MIEAANASAAISLLNEHPDVKVLFTDVEMPGGDNGFVLAGKVVRLSPQVRVVYASGRATLGDRRREHAIPGRMLIKPYRLTHLTGAVRDVCGSLMDRL